MTKWTEVERDDFYESLKERNVETKEIMPDETKPLLVLRYYENDLVIGKSECYGKECNYFLEDNFYNSNYA